MNEVKTFIKVVVMFLFFFFHLLLLSTLIFRDLTFDFYLSSVRFNCLKEVKLSNSKIVKVIESVIDF